MNTQQDQDSSDFFKKKRDEYIVDIRKKKNNDHIEARRLKLTNTPDKSEETVPQVPQEKLNLSLNELAIIFTDLVKSENLAELPKVAREIRLIVSKGDSPPIEELVNTGIVPEIIGLLSPQFFSETELLTECSWIAVNIVSNDIYAKKMAELDIINRAYQLLEHEDQDIKENAIWILANIAGDNYNYRMALLESGITRRIDALFNNRELRPSIHNCLIWLISNLCRGKPYPEFGLVASLLYYLQTYIKDCKGQSFISHCLNALSSLTDTDDESQIQEILDMDILGELVELLKTSNYKLKGSILRTLGNIASSSESHIEVLIEKGFIEAIYPLMQDEKKFIRREACFVYSHILSGSTEQINAVFAFEDGKIIETMFHIATHDIPEVAEECIFALCNSVGGGVKEVQFLVDVGIIEMIIELLTKTEREDLISECLDALYSILTDGKDLASGPSPQDNPYFVQFESLKGVSVVEKLLDFPDPQVFEKVERLLGEFVEGR